MDKKLIAEALGTFILVFLGSCAIVFMGPEVGKVGIALAFGLGVVAAAYGIGAISGAHLNPAVSIGMMVAGRITTREFAGYVLAQVVGAIAAILVIMAMGGTAEGGLGQTTVGASGPIPAVIFEFVATFLFVTVILGATEANGAGPLAGLAIGLTLVLIHLAGINISGASVNPARSLAPALFVGGAALEQMWLYILAPLAGGFVAGTLNRSGFSRATA